jgi:undecaprenyl-diphosphatase
MAGLTRVSAEQTNRTQKDVRALGEYHKIIVPVYFVVAAIALAALSLMVHTGGPLPIDLAAAHAVQSVQAGWYDIIMRIVGEPGYPPQVYVVVVWIVFVLWLTGLRWEAVAEVFATVGIGVVGLVIKMIVNRPRPTPDLIHVIQTLDNGKLSFPAGHVESIVAIIGFLWFLSFTLSRNMWVRTISLFIFGEMIALIGISRVYTGEHWLTDTIGGYLLGSLWLILTVWLYQWGKPRFLVPKSGKPK